jgi:hypothetical protein
MNMMEAMERIGHRRNNHGDTAAVTGHRKKQSIASQGQKLIFLRLSVRVVMNSSVSMPDSSLVMMTS